MSTIDEKLNLANENVPKVYAAGQKSGGATNLQNGESTGSLKSVLALDAVSEGAVALGTDTTAGLKCFEITAFDDANKTYTLDSVEGLEVGDVFSLEMANDYDNVGEITAISGTNVTVDTYQANDGGMHTRFRVPLKPNCGTVYCGENTFVTGKGTLAKGENAVAMGLNTQAKGDNSIAEGEGSVASGKNAKASGTNAKAISEGTVAFGENTVAGSKCFKVVGSQYRKWRDADKNIFYSYGLVLDSTTGLELGDVVSVVINNNYVNIGAIQQINECGNLSVDNCVSITYENASSGGFSDLFEIEDAGETTAHLKEELSESSCLWVALKPTVGTSDFGINAVASGKDTIANGPDSSASGSGTHAIGKYAHTEGKNTKAGYAGHSEGTDTAAMGVRSHAEGFGSEATGNHSHAEGFSFAKREAAHSEGNNTTASGFASHSEGSASYAYSNNSHAEGYGTKAGIESEDGKDGKCAHAEGNGTTASGEAAHSEGNNTTASGFASHSEGSASRATGRCSHAEGYAYADADYAHAEGTGVANGVASHAEGTSTANGKSSHAEGEITTATGEYSHSEGKNTKASGKGSHAEGNETTASGENSHAEGYKSTASGDKSHTEGWNTIAKGRTAHAEGWDSQAIKDGDHAENCSTAQGGYSHAEGYGTKASSQYQHVQGKWNREDTANKYAHIVGNGTSDTARSNAHTVDWSGNAWYAGDVESEKYGKLSEKESIANKDKPNGYVGLLSDGSIYLEQGDLMLYDGYIQTSPYSKGIEVYNGDVYVESDMYSDNPTDHYLSKKADRTYVDNAVKKSEENQCVLLSNALKGTAIGENAVRINDSSPVEHEMSVRVRSKNLIGFNVSWIDGAEREYNGLTFSQDYDEWIYGAVKINGTATADGQIICDPSYYDYFPLSVPKGNYKLSGATGGSIATFYLQAYVDGKYGQADVSGGNYTILPGQKITSVVFYFKKGATFDNYILKPQLERGTTATDYIPWVDPTNVILTQRGKNLLTYPYHDTAGAKNGVTYTVNDNGSIVANGTATAVANFMLMKQSNKLALKGDYTLSSGISNDNMAGTFGLALGYKYGDDARVVTGTINGVKQIELTDNAMIDAVAVVRANQTVSNLTFYPQFELGDAATEYESPLPEITYSVPEDGIVTGVKNIYPTTTLLSNTDNVIIDVEYNRDINKAFEELQNAILSLGGNI